MIKVTTTCSFDDLLEHAQAMGIHWNYAHKILVEARIYVGVINTDHYADGPYCSENEHVEARNILKNFMEKHQLEQFYITPKHYDC